MRGRAASGAHPVRVRRHACFVHVGDRRGTCAAAGNRRLEADFDRLNGPDQADLAAARAGLQDAAATERAFDQRLARITFPAETEAIARLLVITNQSRSRLTAAAAGSVSLTRLRAFERQLAAANGPVEDAVTVLRSQLGLPSPDTS